MSLPVLFVRATSVDVLLVTLGIGLVIILFFCYICYLAVRYTRSLRPGYKESKADRPIWIFALIVAGSTWIMSTLFSSGSLMFVPELRNSCTLVRFIAAYTVGFSLWISLVLYKLVRKYYQVRRIDTKPPHAVTSITALMLPPFILGLSSVFFDTSWRNGSDVCIHVFWYPLLHISTLLIFYATAFAILTLKIRMAIGEHHEVYRYTLFLSSSLAFMLYELFLHTTSMSNYLFPQQLSVILAWILIFANMTHIFILVIRSKKVTMKHLGIEEELRDDVVLSFTSASSQYDNGYPANDPILDGVNRLLSEAPLEPKSTIIGTPIASGRPPMILVQRPRRLPTDHMIPPLSRYVEALPERLSSQVDSNRALFAVGAQSGWSPPRKRTSPIVDFDLTEAERHFIPPA